MKIHPFGVRGVAEPRLVGRPPRSPWLRRRLSTGPILVAPGAYDALTARLVEQAGFEAVYFSGAGLSYTLRARRDMGLLTMSEMADHVAYVAAATRLPVIADADTGYGGEENVARTVRAYAQAGAAALHIEDQEWPKRCGHLEGKRIVPPEEMGARIRAASAARPSPDFLVIARTDARAVEGLDAAIARARHYKDAGADVLFVEAQPPISRGSCLIVLNACSHSFESGRLLNLSEGVSLWSRETTPVSPCAPGCDSRNVRSSDGPRKSG